MGTVEFTASRPSWKPSIFQACCTNEARDSGFAALLSPAKAVPCMPISAATMTSMLTALARGERVKLFRRVETGITSEAKEFLDLGFGLERQALGLVSLGVLDDDLGAGDLVVDPLGV